MIVRPKLPLQLPSALSPVLEPALALENAEITALDWSTQDAKRLSLDAIRLITPDFTGAQLRDGGWADVEIKSGQLAGLNLSGSMLRRLVITGSRADGLVLAETDGRDITIRDSKLDLANFRFAKWSRIQFINCSLREADFAGATFKSVTFTNCHLTACDFNGAKLTAVDLRSSRLEGLRGMTGLEGAIMDYDQLMGLVPELAASLGIILKDS